MQKILFYSSIFTPEETNTMGKQLITLVESSKSTDENLLIAKDVITSGNDKLTGVLKASLVNPFTKPLGQADDWRDSIFLGGRNMVEAYTHWVFDVAKKEAAERLMEVFTRHGWKLHKFNYQNQSSATNSLIIELKKPELQADLATLGLIAWYDELIKSQQSFESIFNLKAGAKNSKESVEKKDAQIPVNEAIDGLITYLNSIMMFNKNNETWNKIYNDAEGIIKQMTTTARTRRSANNKPVDTDKPDDKK